MILQRFNALLFSIYMQFLLATPKFLINDTRYFNEGTALQDYSVPENVENLFYFYDIKFAYNRLKGLRHNFYDKMAKSNLTLRNNLTEMDIFKNFEDLTTSYKSQVTCSICKKTFKTSHYLWIHNTRRHLFEKFNQTDPSQNVFWVSNLAEFLDWDAKNFQRMQDYDLTPDVYSKFQKCLLFAKKYVDSVDFDAFYEFCLGFYFEKDSKGKFHDMMSSAYNIFFKGLLVVFVIACLIYYSFAYYIYLDYSAEFKKSMQGFGSEKNIESEESEED